MSDMKHKPGDPSALQMEAASWIAQLDREELSETDRLAFREWCGRSPAHREALREMAAVWSELDRLPELLAEAEHVRPRLTPRPFWIAHAAIAASLLVAAAAWLGFLAPGSTEVYQTAVGQQQAFRLADGSQVHLNTATKLTVRLGRRERDIRLEEGEALFTVAHDPKRPFVVTAGKETVRALGTAFLVRRGEGAVRVTVSQGTVGVGHRNLLAQVNDVAVLRAQQTATVSDKGGSPVVIGQMRQDDLNRATAWTRGVLEFEGESLQAVIDEMERYTSMRVEIQDPSLGRTPVAGRFRVGDMETLLELLREGFGARVTPLGPDRVLVTRS